SYYSLERIMVAMYVVITKATYVTGMELFALQIPSISLSFKLNPIDDSLSLRIPTNIPLNASCTDAELLTREILRCLEYRSTVSLGGIQLSDLTNPGRVAHHVSKTIMNIAAIPLNAAS